MYAKLQILFCRQLQLQHLTPVLHILIFLCVLAEDDKEASKSHLQKCWHAIVYSDGFLLQTDWLLARNPEEVGRKD